MIQRLISERHGKQRARLGWRKEELKREFRILREEVDALVRRDTPDRTNVDMEEALDVIHHLLKRAEEISLAGFAAHLAGLRGHRLLIHPARKANSAILFPDLPAPHLPAPPMLGQARGLRLPEDLKQEIAREAAERRSSWSATTRELLREAIRMRRVPGIVFGDTSGGRCPTLAGTELEVWRIIAAWEQGPQTLDEFRGQYPWLSDTQLRTALSYYQIFPEEIDTWIGGDRPAAPHTLQQELPLLTVLG